MDLGVLVGEVVMMGLIGTTTNQEEMVSIGQVSGKRGGGCQDTKYQEVDKIPKSHLIEFLNKESEVSINMQLRTFTVVGWKFMISIFSGVGHV